VYSKSLFQCTCGGKQVLYFCGSLRTQKEYRKLLLKMTDLIYLIDVTGKFENWHKKCSSELNRKTEK
jgi:hypothetical protein